MPLSLAQRETPGGPFTWLAFSVSDNLWRVEVSETVPLDRREVVFYKPGDELTAKRGCATLGRDWDPGEWFSPPYQLLRWVLPAAGHHFGCRDRRTRRVGEELDHYVDQLRARRYEGPCPACGYDDLLESA